VTETAQDTTTTLGEAEHALAYARDIAKGETPSVRPAVPTVETWRALPLAVLRTYLDELLVSRFPEPGLDALHELGCLDAWLPEVSGMVGFGDGEFRHKDVWKHTKQVVKQAMPRLEVRWGALLHDIGKPKTRRIEPDGSVTFYGHAELGAAMFRKRVRARLGFDGAFGDRVHFLILHHLRASQYDGSWTDSAVRRFYKQMGDGLRDLLDLSRADITTKRPERRKRGVRQISDLGKRIKELQALDDRTPPLPKGIGIVMTEVLGIAPSKQLGDLKKRMEQEAEDGVVERGRDLDFYKAWLTTHKERYLSGEPIPVEAPSNECMCCALS
jgi:poly(A) polymerase